MLTCSLNCTMSPIANKKRDSRQAWLAHSILWRPDKGLPAVTREILSCHWSKVWKIGKLFPWETCVQSSIRWWHKKFNPFGCYASTWGKREKQGQSVAKLHKQQVCNYHSFAFLLLPTFSSYFVDFESKLESPLPRTTAAYGEDDKVGGSWPWWWVAEG